MDTLWLWFCVGEIRWQCINYQEEHLLSQLFTCLNFHREFLNFFELSFYIKSVPNEPFAAHLENYIENNEHVFKISFTDYSEIETNYRIRYRNIKNEFEKYDELSKQERRVLYDK